MNYSTLEKSIDCEGNLSVYSKTYHCDNEETIE